MQPSAPYSDASEALNVAGYLKWYDAEDEYGFFVDDLTGEDVLIYSSALHAFGQLSITRYCWIEAKATRTARGLRVAKITKILPPKIVRLVPPSNLEPSERLSSGFVPARVTWYDQEKGYGYARPYGGAEDCFIHAKTLKRAGTEYVECGEAIVVSLVRGAKGLIATEVAPWDRNLANSDQAAG